MKQFRCLIILLALLLLGCTKDFPVDTGDTTTYEDSQPGSAYNPTGNLVFYVDSLGMLPFSDNCTHICFAIYDMDGARIKQTNQKLGDNHYGAVGMQLDEGTYRVVVVAHSCNKNPTMTNPAKIQFNNNTSYSDTYLYHDTVEVYALQRRIHINLRRIVARCSFIIRDAIPDSVAQMKISYKGGSAHFDASTGYGVTNSTQTIVGNAVLGEQNTQYDLYTIPFGPDEDTLTLTVMALSVEDNIILEREFRIPVRCNRLTWFAGSFFWGAASDEWSVIAGQDFDSSWPEVTYLTY